MYFIIILKGSNGMNFFNKDIFTGYSLTKHLKNISDNDDKYKNLYATWV